MIHWQYITFPPINLWTVPVQWKNLEKIERDTPTARRWGRGERGAFFHRISTGKSQATPQVIHRKVTHLYTGLSTELSTAKALSRSA